MLSGRMLIYIQRITIITCVYAGVSVYVCIIIIVTRPAKINHVSTYYTELISSALNVVSHCRNLEESPLNSALVIEILFCYYK